MPRTARASVGGFCYHVLNRGNARRAVFHKDGDFRAFLKALGQVAEAIDLRPLGYCLMPNHFHLVLWPQGDTDLSRGLHWLLTAHVRRYHRHYRASGHLWQGRFKKAPTMLQSAPYGAINKKKEKKEKVSGPFSLDSTVVIR